MNSFSFTGEVESFQGSNLTHECSSDKHADYYQEDTKACNNSQALASELRSLVGSRWTAEPRANVPYKTE